MFKIVFVPGGFIRHGLWNSSLFHRRHHCKYEIIYQIRTTTSVSIRDELQPGLLRSRVPSRPAGRDPGRDGFFQSIFEKTRPTKFFFSKMNKIGMKMMYL